MDISIDKKSPLPAYEQVVQQVRALIEDGRLRSGDRLPADRELAARLGIARGTIRRAYEELERGSYVEMVRGSGTYVGIRPATPQMGRKEHAEARIVETVQRLEALRFSYREMRAMFELTVQDREERLGRFVVAAVDCNPESLAVYEKQLVALARVRVRAYLLDTVKAAPDPHALLEPFDLVITTTTHHREVLELLPGLESRLCPVVVSPTHASIAALAALSCSQRLGVLCGSQKFLEIILAKLEELKVATGPVAHVFFQDEERLPAFLADKDALIVPPGFSPQSGRPHTEAIRDFTLRGGRLTVFDYQIEQGSLLHLRERIDALLNTRSTATQP